MYILEVFWDEIGLICEVWIYVLCSIWREKFGFLGYCLLELNMSKRLLNEIKEINIKK